MALPSTFRRWNLLAAVMAYAAFGIALAAHTYGMWLLAALLGVVVVGGVVAQQVATARTRAIRRGLVAGREAGNVESMARSLADARGLDPERVLDRWHRAAKALRLDPARLRPGDGVGAFFNLCPPGWQDVDAWDFEDLIDEELGAADILPDGVRIETLEDFLALPMSPMRRSADGRVTVGSL